MLQQNCKRSCKKCCLDGNKYTYGTVVRQVSAYLVAAILMQLNDELLPIGNWIGWEKLSDAAHNHDTTKDDTFFIEITNKLCPCSLLNLIAFA